MTDNQLTVSISDKMEAQINAKLQPLNNKFTELEQNLKRLASEMEQLESDTSELTAITATLKDSSEKVKTNAANLTTKVTELKSNAATWKTNAAKLETEAAKSGICTTPADKDIFSFETEISQKLEMLANHQTSLKDKLLQTIQRQRKPVLYETQASELKFRIKQLEHKLNLSRS